MNDYEVIFVSFIYFLSNIVGFGPLLFVAVYKIKFKNKIQLKAK
jgi:hypothetical protein